MTVRNIPPTRPTDAPLPPLRHGERVSQPEFHRRYEAMPGNQKFELVGGEVYMASPVFGPHATRLAKLLGPFGVYEASTPGVEVSTDSSVILSRSGEPRPDIALRILPEFGGRTVTDRNGCPVGGPELIVEVSESTERFDLGPKRQDYRSAGVLEYLVLCLDSQRLRTFDLLADIERDPDVDGVWRSRVFPGLWIDAAAALAADAAKLLSVLQAGLATKEHAEFAARLRQQGENRK